MFWETWCCVVWYIHVLIWQVCPDGESFERSDVVMFVFRISVYLYYTYMRTYMISILRSWKCWETCIIWVYVGFVWLCTGLFWGYIGPFCVYVGLFCVYVGLFCVYIGLKVLRDAHHLHAGRKKIIYIQNGVNHLHTGWRWYIDASYL